MKKRVLILITALVLCVLIPSASVPAAAVTADTTSLGMIESLPETVSSADVTNDPDYLAYRSFLNENSAVVAALYNGISALEARIDVSRFGVPVNDLPALMHVMFLSFPELFCMTGYRYEYLRSGTVLAIEPKYTVADPEEKQRLFFEAAESRYLPLITDDMDDFTKAVILHDELLLNVSYDSARARLADNYTCMVEGWGVCQQYTECYAYLLAQCGIKSEFIKSDQMSHAWLKVLLDGSYYNVDITWDDPLPDKTGKAYHRYFLFSDSAFQAEDTALSRSRHYEYRSIHPADSTKYDRFDNLHGFSTQLCYLNGAFYAITKDGKLVRYDHHTDAVTVLRTLDFTWPAGANRYWVGNFSSLVPFDEMLYYNSPDEIYRYDPEKDKTELFAENSGEDPLYGLRVIDNQLWVVRADSPNEGFIAPTYLKDLPVPNKTPRIGNVDGDDDVTIFDATAIQRWLARLSTSVFNKEAADCDGDGDVTIIDATVIQRWLAGLPTSGQISDSSA